MGGPSRGSGGEAIPGSARPASPARFDPDCAAWLMDGVLPVVALSGRKPLAAFTADPSGLIV